MKRLWILSLVIALVVTACIPAQAAGSAIGLSEQAPDQAALVHQADAWYLTGLEATGAAMPVSALTGWFSLTPLMQVEWLDAAGAPLPSDSAAATGQTARITEQGSEVGTVALVLWGDVTGSGRFDLTQMVRIAGAMTGSVALAPAQSLAADLNRDGHVGIGDVVRAAQWLVSTGQSLYEDLEVGMESASVERLQQRLQELGYLRAYTRGVFDAATKSGVAAFQERAGLEATGMADGRTQEALYAANAPACPLPLAGVVIGLDPGHQERGNAQKEPVAPGSSTLKPKVSSGTEGIVTHVEEHAVNLAVGLALRALLEEMGATVVMTRETAAVDISNAERAQKMNAAGADLVVRLHCDGEEDKRRHGAFVLIPSGPHTIAIQPQSRSAAQTILAAFVETTGAKSLGLSERSDQTGFNWSTVPVIGIEMGHMSNPEEDRKLASAPYQALCAQGIAEGIRRYFS